MKNLKIQELWENFKSTININSEKEKRIREIFEGKLSRIMTNLKPQIKAK
jgi:hypothetical protein